MLKFKPSVGKLYDERRRERAGAPVVPLPDLRTGLEEYRQNVRRLALECQVRGTRCLFLTQPTVWRKGLAPAEEKLLWFGWVGRKEKKKGYVAVAELAQAMDEYNQVLLDVCRQDELECYDLASSVPKDTSAFYDDVHSNEGGAQIVAQLLTDYLLRGDVPLAIKPGPLRVGAPGPTRKDSNGTGMDVALP